MSNPLGDELTYPLDIPPKDGEIRVVEPGLYWIRLSLPFRLDHVNVWAIEGAGGWTVIDTGLDDGRTRAAWKGLLNGALAGRPVERVVATHFHPDHIALAAWLADRTGASFAASLTDWLFARTLSTDDTPGQAATVERFYRRAGLDGEALDALLDRGNAYARLVKAVPPVLTRLRHGDALDMGAATWRVIAGAGHTPEPVCLFRPADASGRAPLLISGDQVLPVISPNISVWPTEPDADPLADYLESFDALLALPEETLVLPSHGAPFRGLHLRLAGLRRHHEERLAEIAELCTTPRTAAQVADAVFRPDLDTHQKVFALGEAVAHLNHLVGRGAITRATGPSGTLLYGPRRSD